MARKSFTVNTEPHVAEVGGKEYEFQPEVLGDEFLDGYAALKDGYKEAGIDPNNLEDVDPAALRKITVALRSFLTRLMLPASAEHFATARIPDRVLVELLEWINEVYGGAKRPPTSSTGSSPRSSRGGKPGTGTSRSKGSTRAVGPSPAS